MNRFQSLIACALLALSPAVLADGPPVLSENAPEDCPMKGPVELLMSVIDELSPEAMREWPEVRRRFESGLPDGEHLFVTTILEAPSGDIEYIFMSVDSFRGAKVVGYVAVNILNIPGVQYGDPITITEDDIADWLITKPDGGEEGNRIGLELERYSNCNHEHP